MYVSVCVCVCVSVCVRVALGAAQSAAHCSKCVHLDGLNAENTFHSSLYSV